MKNKLDKRRYVSLSRDRQLASTSPTNAESQEGEEEELESTNAIQPLENEEDMSLFDIHMPGVLTVEQVKALDLDHWLLLVRGTLVHMIVSIELSSLGPIDIDC